jgi:hypothetical protein
LARDPAGVLLWTRQGPNRTLFRALTIINKGVVR